MTTIKIHNVETGEIVEREMNAEELAQRQADKVAAEEQAQAEAQAMAKRQELLSKLGITEEEFEILLS